MKLLVQWSLAEPQDWIEVEAAAWRSLARRPTPKGDEVIDNSPGWIYDLACQGIWMGGMDHLAVEPLPRGGAKVWGWNDDLEDFPVGSRWGRVMTFDRDLNQTKTYYCEPDAAPVQTLGAHFHQGPGGVRHEVEYLPWEDFPVPDDEITLHGIWLPDELEQRHAEVRRVPDYREWL